MMDLFLPKDIPPLPFLKQVALHWPDALWLYIYLWEKKDDGSHVYLSDEEIDYNFDPSEFKKNLRNLSLDGLISYVTKSGGDYVIEMVEWEDIQE